MLARGKLALLCLLAAIVGSSLAFRRGDIVRMTKRSTYGGQQSEWSDVMSKYCPRYMVDKTVFLQGVSMSGYNAAMAYKMSFAFGESRHVTSWVTIADGKGKIANYITFTFVYSGSSIKSVSWKVDYNDDEHQGKFSGELIVHFNWVADNDVDTAFGLNVLFVSGFGVTCVLVAVAMLDVKRSIGFQKLTRPSAPSGGARTRAEPLAKPVEFTTASPSVGPMRGGGGDDGYSGSGGVSGGGDGSGDYGGDGVTLVGGGSGGAGGGPGANLRARGSGAPASSLGLAGEYSGGSAGAGYANLPTSQPPYGGGGGGDDAGGGGGGKDD